MADPVTKTEQLGALHVTTMDFVAAGDQLQRHWHQADSIHISIVARGSFRFLGREGEFPHTVMPNDDKYEIDRTVKVGTVLDWDVGKDHSFIALEPNSRLINIRKN